MAGDSTQRQSEIYARRDRLSPGDLHGRKPDVVGVFQRADRAAAIEGDVELPGQPVHLAMVQDVIVHRPGERAGVDQFLSIDAGGGAGGDVADVVRTRAAGDDPEIAKSFQHIDGIGGLDLANLKIGPRGDIRVPTAKIFGEFGDAAKLGAAGHPAVDSQAAHEGILGRRNVKHALILEDQHIPAFGELAFLRVLHHQVP